MKNIRFDFFNDSKRELISKFSIYFNLNYYETYKYFENVDKQVLDVNKVVKDLNIDLNNPTSSYVEIVGRHMTTATDEGLESVKNNGLLDLKRMLQCNTTLSNFLKKYGIEVDVDRKIIFINDKEYPILSD